MPLPPSPHPALHPALRALGCGQSLNLAQLQAGGDPQRPHVRARGWGAGGGFVLCAVFTHAEKRAPSLETVDPDHLQELREHTPPLSQLSPDRGGLAPQSATAVLRTPGLTRECGVDGETGAIFIPLPVFLAGLCLCMCRASVFTYLCAHIHAGVSLFYLGVRVRAPLCPYLSPKCAQAWLCSWDCAHTCVSLSS